MSIKRLIVFVLVAPLALPVSTQGKPAGRSLTFQVEATKTGGKTAPSVECVVSAGPQMPICALAFGPDGKTLAVGGYKEVLIWDLAGAALAMRIGADQITVTVHALRKDGFKGAIKLTAKDLPDGYTVSNAMIPQGAELGRFTLTVPADAPTGIVSPAFVGTAALDDETVTRPALPCEELMQAFIYKHLVPTGALLMKVTEPVSFTLTHDAPTDKALQIKQGATVKINIKADRTEAANAAIAVAADTPPRGITVKRANIAKDAHEAVVTITATKQARIGFESNIILTGTMKVGKETTTVVLPAVSIKVIDPKQQQPPQPKKVVQAKKSQNKKSDPKKDNPQKKAPPEKTADKK